MFYEETGKYVSSYMHVGCIPGRSCLKDTSIFFLKQAGREIRDPLGNKDILLEAWNPILNGHQELAHGFPLL